MTPSAPRLRSWTTAVVAGLALALVAVAFSQNRKTVGDLTWPGLDIQFRELAAAQTLLDQGYGPDANYPNEHVWYNPMTSWIIAGASALSGRPVPAVSSHLGPYLNLVAPASLFLLTALVFDTVSAVAAIAAFIFLVGTEFNFYDSATYSPWFSPESFGQAWLYLLLAASSRAFRPAASAAWPAVCGLLLGLTFLTHTAPALLGGAVLVLLGFTERLRLGGARESLKRAGLALAVAFAVSLPFAFEILWRYHLRIVNLFPGQSPSTILDLNELPGLARTIAVPAGVAAVALALRGARKVDLGIRIVLAWCGVVLALLAINAVRLVLESAGVHLLPVVPAFHFFFYLMTIVAIGVGVGVRDASAAIVTRFSASRAEASEREAAGGLLACGATLLLVVAWYPKYLERPDFTEIRREAVSLNQQLPVDVVGWIRAHTSPDDVFLCTDDTSMYVVPPAGRKVVSTNRYFSNPYVDWVSRDADRSRMFERLTERDVDGFFEVAARYRVRFILLTRDRSRAWLQPAGLVPEDLPEVDAGSLAALGGFELVYESRRFAILAVKDGAGRAVSTKRATGALKMAQEITRS